MPSCRVPICRAAVAPSPRALALVAELRRRQPFEVYERLAELRREDPALAESVRRLLLMGRARR